MSDQGVPAWLRVESLEAVNAPPRTERAVDLIVDDDVSEERNAGGGDQKVAGEADLVGIGRGREGGSVKLDRLSGLLIHLSVEGRGVDVRLRSLWDSSHFEQVRQQTGGGTDRVECGV